MTKITTMAEVLERAKRRELLRFAQEGGPPIEPLHRNCINSVRFANQPELDLGGRLAFPLPSFEPPLGPVRA